MDIKKITVVFLVLSLFIPILGSAQSSIINFDRIHSLQVLQNGGPTNVPFIELNTNDQLLISFDDLTKEYHRYIYKVEHCNFDWLPTTSIFESDYLVGSDLERPIEDYHESLNTTVPYTHYQFRFPNSRMRIKISGNYRIRIFDDDEGKEVCSCCFYAVETKAITNVSATTNTDIDLNQTHQQLSVNVRPQGINLIDASREIKIVVLQNGNRENRVINPKADYYTPSGISWEHNRQLIFDGGNEFRKFEMTNVKDALMGVESIKWFSPYYHATIWTDKPRKNYVYDEDKDGLYFINSTDRSNDDYESDYLLAHFLFLHEPVTDGEYYLYGALTNWSIEPQYKMLYNSEYKGYESALLLKEGYYNYQYLFVPACGKARGAETEGDFYQTENEYTVLVYYSPRGGRYDHLIGIRSMFFEPSKQ